MSYNSTIQFESIPLSQALFGHRNENLNVISSALTIDLHAHGTKLSLSGDPVDVKTAITVLEQLYELLSAGRSLTQRDIKQSIAILREDSATKLSSYFLNNVLKGARGREITPRTSGQKRYVHILRNHAVVFGLGPAGTGKTYLAMAMAVSALNTRKVKRIILARPAVEAGERLGFLPGDLMAKVNPYLRPLYDALHDMMEFERVEQLRERGAIEVVPLAFMRGRTLNDSFVILDEAQNTTKEQMKMFLTRLGYDSMCVITGDTSQVDLDEKRRSGLAHAVKLLEKVPGIGVCRLTKDDVVRHPLVKRIISAYDKDEKRQEG